MQTLEGRLLLSATDLIGYLECPYLTWLDLERIEAPSSLGSWSYEIAPDGASLRHEKRRDPCAEPHDDAH
jgi:hypothetical protein